MSDRYVSNLVLATGTAVADNNGQVNGTKKLLFNLSTMTYITPPVGSGIAALSQAVLNARGANGLKNLTVILINSAGTAGTPVTGGSGTSLMKTYKIQTSVNAGTGASDAGDYLTVATDFVDNSSATGAGPTVTPGATTRFEIRYGGDCNDGTTQHPANNASYWTQAYDAAVGPKATGTDAFYTLDHTPASPGGPLAPDHHIYYQYTARNYNEGRNGATVTTTLSAARLILNPGLADTPETVPTSYTLIQGYSATPGDLFPSAVTYPVSGDIDTAAIYATFPTLLITTSGAMVTMVSNGTSDWGVIFETIRTPNTAGTTVSNTALTGSIYASACEFGASGTAIPFLDGSASGTSKVFSFTRCKVATGTASPFTAISCDTFSMSGCQVRAGAASAADKPIVFVSNASATSTLHTKNVSITNCDIQHTAEGSNTTCECIRIQGMVYGESIKITDNNTLNRANRSYNIAVYGGGPPRIDIARNNVWSYNVGNGSGIPIRLGADASVETPIFPSIYNTHRLLFAGAVTSSTNNGTGGDSAENLTDDVVIVDATSRALNEFRYCLVRISDGPGRERKRMVVSSTAGTNCTLTLNPRWTGAKAWDTVAAQADGTAAAPPTSASKLEIWQAVPSKISVRDNLCVYLKVPTNYSGTVNSHGMLVAQGMDNAEVVRNIIIGHGDDGFVLKADHVTATQNIFCGGRGGLDLKGANYCKVTNHTFVCALHGGASGIWTPQDKSSLGGSPDPALAHVYDSKCQGNTLENCILAVYRDPISGANDAYCIQDSDQGAGTWQGGAAGASLYPTLQSNRMDYNCYWQATDAAASFPFYINGANVASLTALKAVWAASAEQYPDNDQHSMFADPQFKRLSTLIASLADMTGLFTSSYASMATDRALAESYFEIAAGSPAAGAGAGGVNIGSDQSAGGSGSNVQTGFRHMAFLG